MPLISKTIPNLINGVSQQPPSLRLDTQGEVQENGLSDVVTGLSKRPHTENVRRLESAAITTDFSSHPDTGGVATLTDDIPSSVTPIVRTYVTTYSTLPLAEASTCHFHSYRRDKNERYIVAISSGDTGEGESTVVRVYDKQGYLCYQTGQGSWKYTAGSLPALGAAVTSTVTFPSLYSNELCTFTAAAGKLTLISSGSVLNDGWHVGDTISITNPVAPTSWVNNGLWSIDSIDASANSLTLTALEGQTATAESTPLYCYVYRKALTQTLSLNELKTQDVTYTGDLVLRDSATTSYLDDITKTDVKATSVADTTFILNKTKVVAKTSTASPERPFEGLLYLKATGYAKKYEATVYNAIGSLVDSGYVQTEDSHGSHSEYTLRSGNIIDVLVGGGADDQVADHDDLVLSASFDITRDDGDPFAVISHATSDFDIKATDDAGGQHFFSFKDTAKSFSSLPAATAVGFTTKVIGDNQRGEDDFYVQYKDGTSSSGQWVEVAEPSRPNSPVYNELDATTMPHQLKQNADGSFSFEAIAWDARIAGDDNTNPFPSFVGTTINEVFFHKNRLGFLASDNVIFSELGGYYNLFRTTVRTLLDTDPIDVAVGQTDVTLLKAAIPFQEQLLLFSETGQYTLTSTHLLTPTEVAVERATAFDCDLNASPVAAGTSAFFATSTGAGTGVREMYTQNEFGVKDAGETTGHVPTYIEGNVQKMISSSSLNTLMLQASTNAEHLYVYRWYDTDKERLQSSWSKWTFSRDILDFAFDDSSVYFVFDREDGAYLEELSFEQDRVLNLAGGQIGLPLDRRVRLNNHAAYQTFATDNGEYPATGGGGRYVDSNGVDLTGSGITPSSSSDYPLFYGQVISFKYELSEQNYKPDGRIASDIARLQLRNIRVTYQDTANVTVKTTPEGRDTSSVTYQSDGSAGSFDGVVLAGVQSNAKGTSIVLENNTVYSLSIQGAEWEGYVTLRSQRIG